MSQTSSSLVISSRSAGQDANADNSNCYYEPFEGSPNSESQIEFTQLTQPGLTPDESSNAMPILSSNQTPLSPPPIIPFGRLVPCAPSAKLTAVDLMPTQESYWLGRSYKCDITAHYSSGIGETLSKIELASFEWGKSMISNRHCRVFQQNNGNQIFIEDNSGNGTFINQQTHLRKGETRILHSGDEICLINIETLRKKISSYRVIQMVLQQFSFIIVQSKPRKSCVNPRAMNYNFGRNHLHSSNNERQTNSIAETSANRRIETFYDMREVLGDGTSGQVRRAIHRQSGEERAVKILSLRRCVDVSIMEREVKLLQSLDHPYIVKLIEVFVQHDVAMYLVMELVKGGDLFDSIVEKQRYTAIEARRAMRRLLSAVHYLHHESNIVHRDLKPENILCSSPTDVKLADFGLAKIMKADGLKTFCGTPAYFAPEVLRRRHTVAGEGSYGKPADIWSLGVILYILLTGKPPFDPDVEESSKPFEVDFESDGHIWSSTPHAQDLVQKMLCLNPQQRLTVHQACDHFWVNVYDGDTHCHPLDDPALNTKKYFLNRKSKANDLGNANIGLDATTQGDLNSSSLLCSEDGSPLTKNEYATPVSSHGRTSNAFHVKSLEPTKVGVGITHTILKIGTPKQLISKNGEGVCCNLNSNCKDTDDDEKIQTRNERLTSVSSSDRTSSPPKFPLTKLNFNRRSNEFRKHIIKEANLCPPLFERRERFESPNGNELRQVAVTPARSNIKPLPEPFDLDTEEGDKNIEDSDLSQASSIVSSVESFTDAPENESSQASQACPVPTTKRFLEEDKSKTAMKSPKRCKKCSSKQTTLNSWLLKKA